MRKAPAGYLQELAKLGLTFVAGPDWQPMREIVATRNVLVHKSQLIADATYINQAGDSKRADLGNQLTVDSSYSYESIIAIRSMLYDILAQPNAT